MLKKSKQLLMNVKDLKAINTSNDIYLYAEKLYEQVATLNTPLLQSLHTHTYIYL